MLKKTHLLPTLVGLAARLGLSWRQLGRLAQRRVGLLLKRACIHHWLPLAHLWGPTRCTRSLACSSRSMAASSRKLYFSPSGGMLGSLAAEEPRLQKPPAFSFGQARCNSRWAAGRSPTNGLGEGIDNLSPPSMPFTQASNLTCPGCRLNLLRSWQCWMALVPLLYSHHRLLLRHAP